MSAKPFIESLWNLLEARGVIQLAESVKGEYWIFPEGGVHYCDGDVGDDNHESYAMRTAQSKVRDEMGLGDSDDEFDDAQTLLADIRRDWEANENPSDEDQEKLDDYDVADRMATKHSVNSDLMDVALNRANADARHHAISAWGWAALRGNHVEVHQINEETLRMVADGIKDIWDEEGIEDEDIDPEDEYFISTYTGTRSVRLNAQEIQNDDFSRVLQQNRVAPHGPNAQVKQMDVAQIPDAYKGRIGD